MKLTVITINLNNRDGLEKTMQSVLSQRFKDFEYLIIDGGSVDGSCEVIAQYAQGLSGWVSEPDKGIYHAMNKGIRLVRSQYILFLNSGDFLIDQNTLGNMVPHLGSFDIVYGNLRFVQKGSYKDHSYPVQLTFSYFLSNSIGHPAAFIRLSLFEKVGLYDESMTICADWAFFIRAIGLFKATYLHVPITVAIFETNGRSSLAQNRQVMMQERMAVLKNDFSFFEANYETYQDLKENIEALRRSKPYRFLKLLGLPKYQA